MEVAAEVVEEQWAQSSEWKSSLEDSESLHGSLVVMNLPAS